MHLLDKLLAIARRDILIAKRYRFSLGFQAVALLFEIAGSYYLARAVGPGFRPEGMNYFLFLLVGTGFYTLLLTGTTTFVNSVQEAQTTGTMEVLMSTATPGTVFVMLSAMSAFGGRLIGMVAYLAFGLMMFRVSLPHPNLLGCALVVVLSLLSAVAIGMIAAAIQVAVQKGSVVVWLLGTVGWLFTGMTFPVSVLPKPLRAVAACIPFKYSLDGVRLALVRGASLGEMAPTLTALAGFGAVLLPLGVLLFGSVLRHARLRGTLSYY